MCPVSRCGWLFFFDKVTKMFAWTTRAGHSWQRLLMDIAKVGWVWCTAVVDLSKRSTFTKQNNSPLWEFYQRIGSDLGIPARLFFSVLSCFQDVFLVPKRVQNSSYMYFLPSEKIRQGWQILILLNFSVKKHHFKIYEIKSTQHEDIKNIAHAPEKCLETCLLDAFLTKKFPLWIN